MTRVTTFTPKAEVNASAQLQHCNATSTERLKQGSNITYYLTLDIDMSCGRKASGYAWSNAGRPWPLPRYDKSLRTPQPQGLGSPHATPSRNQQSFDVTATSAMCQHHSLRNCISEAATQHQGARQRLTFWGIAGAVEAGPQPGRRHQYSYSHWCWARAHARAHGRHRQRMEGKPPPTTGTQPFPRLLPTDTCRRAAWRCTAPRPRDVCRMPPLAHLANPKAPSQPISNTVQLSSPGTPGA